MPKTNWQDPKSSEIISPHISGLQEAVGKLEGLIGVPINKGTNITLSEVYISETDRYRIYQAPEGNRNWLSFPAPIIKKNGTQITTGFNIEYGGGAIVFATPILSTDTITADFSFTYKDGFDSITDKIYKGVNLLLNSDIPIANANSLIGEYSLVGYLDLGIQYTVTLKGTLGINKTKFMAKIGLSEYVDLIDKGNGIYSASFTHSSESMSRIGVYVSGTGTAESAIEWIKLERGSTSTDWTPANQEIGNKLKDIGEQINSFEANLLLKANKQQENWIAPTLLNGWVDYGTIYETAGFYKDSIGEVHLKGLIKDGTKTNGTIVFTLPPGYRPAKRLVISTSSYGSGSVMFSEIGIEANGNVMISSNVGSVYLTLDNINFKAGV